MTGKWGPDTKYWGGTVGSGLFAEKAPGDAAPAAPLDKIPLIRYTNSVRYFTALLQKERLFYAI